MNITYYGHSCFKVVLGGKHVLFDPFITGNPLAKDKVNIDSIEADFILLSHGHGDHVMDVEAIEKRTKAKVVAAFEVAEWFRAKGASTHPMNPGGEWKFDFGTVKCTVAIHSSSMPDGSYGGNPMGFVVKAAEGSFYYSGDTALTYDMKLIGEFDKPQFALLAIGNNFTMGVDDAIRAAQWAGVEKVIALHYDTFGYIVVDHDEAERKFAEAGIELVFLEIGESVDID